MDAMVEVAQGDEKGERRLTDQTNGDKRAAAAHATHEAACNEAAGRARRSGP